MFEGKLYLDKSVAEYGNYIEADLNGEKFPHIGISTKIFFKLFFCIPEAFFHGPAKSKGEYQTKPRKKSKTTKNRIFLAEYSTVIDNII